jgi:hypothetical protein
MKNFLHNFDIFGKPVQMYLNDNHHTKSNSGAILSILLYIIVIITAWFLGKDLVYKENPISYQYTAQTLKYQKLDMTKENFPLAFQIQDTSGSLQFDPKLAIVKMDIFTITYTEAQSNMLVTPVPLQNCKSSDFPMWDEDYFNSTGLSGWQCPEFQNISIYGYWSENELQFVQAYVAYCDYDSTPDYCYSKEEIESYIKGIKKFVIKI